MQTKGVFIKGNIGLKGIITRQARLRSAVSPLVIDLSVFWVFRQVIFKIQTLNRFLLYF
jgi:hypothetical protein